MQRPQPSQAGPQSPIGIDLFEQHATLSDLQQQPRGERRVALQKLRQRARRATTAALTTYTHRTQTNILSDPRIAHQGAEPIRPPVRMRRQGPFSPAIQLTSMTPVNCSMCLSDSPRA